MRSDAGAGAAGALTQTELLSLCVAYGCQYKSNDSVASLRDLAKAACGWDDVKKGFPGDADVPASPVPAVAPIVAGQHAPLAPAPSMPGVDVAQMQALMNILGQHAPMALFATDDAAQ